MDQPKIGRFLKELRLKKGMTQEQLAEIFGVSNRSISRWENGNNMPDLDLVIQIAQYYDIGIDELLNGESTEEIMDKKTEETLLQVADYSNEEKMVLSRRMKLCFLTGLAALILAAVLDALGLWGIALYDKIAGFSHGLAMGVLLIGVLYTSRFMAKIRAFKMRLLHRQK